MKIMRTHSCNIKDKYALISQGTRAINFNNQPAPWLVKQAKKNKCVLRCFVMVYEVLCPRIRGSAEGERVGAW
jgi:hypothetical protein